MVSRRNPHEIDRVIPRPAAHDGKLPTGSALLPAFLLEPATTALLTAPVSAASGLPSSLGLWSGRIGQRTVAIEVPGIQVFDPLPHVAEHVIQTPSVGLFHPDRMGFVLGIGSVPGDVIQWLSQRALRPGSRGVLPLGFGWQAVFITVGL